MGICMLSMGLVHASHCSCLSCGEYNSAGHFHFLSCHRYYILEDSEANLDLEIPSIISITSALPYMKLRAWLLLIPILPSQQSVRQVGLKENG